MIDHNDLFAGLPQGGRLHFTGIGGISMCGLAEIALSEGFRVSGSDMHRNEHTDHLLKLGIPVTIGQSAGNIDDSKPDMVIYSAAVPPGNPELVRARELGIPSAERGLFLGRLTREFTRVINIAGTHGKTTVTAMLAMILLEADVNPTVHLGARLNAFGESTVHLGKSGDLLVSEACEYHNSFLSSQSTTAAVLNIDADHLDYFGTIEKVISTFAEFATQVPDNGWLILPKDGAHIDQMLQELADLHSLNRRSLPALIFFGEKTAGSDGREPEISYHDLTFIDGLPDFDVYWQGEFYTHIHLNVPGIHNVLNALAAIAAAALNGASADSARRALESFRGAEGRFTVKGEYRGAEVVTDYAHHPTAVRATLAAAATVPHKNTWTIFQPLTFSRTKVLFEEFVSALLPASNLLLVEIYSDREQSDLGMSSRLLADEIIRRGGQARFCGGYDEVRDILAASVDDGDLILFLGPEDVRSYGDRLVNEGRTAATY